MLIIVLINVNKSSSFRPKSWKYYEEISEVVDWKVAPFLKKYSQTIEKF